MKIASRSRTRRFRALAACLLLLSAASVGALELWTESIPALPEDASSLVVRRIVTHEAGRRLPGAPARSYAMRRAGEYGLERTIYRDDGTRLWTSHFDLEAKVGGGLRIAGIRAVDQDGQRWHLQFEYDESGRPLSESLEGRNEAPERTIAYDYGGEQDEVVAFRDDGSVSWRRTVEAGSADERATTIFFPDGSRVKTILEQVDSEGRVTSERHLDELGAVYRTIDRRYRFGVPISEEVRDRSGGLLRETVWIYDAFGDLQTRTVRLPQESLAERLIIHYRRNDRGDWIEQVRSVWAQYEGEQPILVDQEYLQREIIYQ